MRNLLFFFCLFITFYFQAQSPKLTLQTGHATNFIGAISPNGKTLVTGGGDGKIIIWDLKSARHFPPLYASMGGITDVIWDEDNEHFYSGDYEGNLTRWNAKTRNIEKQIFSPDSGILKIIRIPNRDMLAVLGVDSSIRLYDKSLNRKKYIRLSGTHGISICFYKAQGISALLVGCRDSTQRIFSIPDLKELNSTSLSDLLLDVCFNADYSRVAYTFPGSVSLMSFPEGKPIQTFQVPFNFYAADGNYSFLSTLFSKPAFYQDSLLLVSGVDNDLIVSHCTKSDSWPDASYSIAKTSSYVTQFLPVPGSTEVISIHQFIKMHRWELKAIGTFPDRFISNSEIEMNAEMATYFDFSPDGKKLLINGSNIHEFSMAEGSSSFKAVYGAKLFEPVLYLDNGTRIGLIDGGEYNEFRIYGNKINHPDTILKFAGELNTISSSADKNYFYVAWKNFVLSKFEAQNCRMIWTDSSLKKTDQSIVKIEEISNGKTLVAYTEDGKLILINAANGKIVREISIVEGVAPAGYISKNGKYFFSAPITDNILKKWNLETGKCEAKVEINTIAEGTGLLADQEEKFLIYYGYDNILRLLDFNTGKEIKQQTKENTYYISVKISPDNKYLITLNGDYIFTVYSYPDLNKLYSLVSVRNKAIDLPFTDDNYYVGGKFLSKLFSIEENGKLFPIEQYDLQYNRPDILLNKTIYGDSSLIRYYQLANEKRIKKYGGIKNINSTSRPEVEIMNREKIQEFVFRRDFSLSLRAKSKNKLKQWNVWVNKVPIQENKVLYTAQKSLLDTSITFSLQHGENLIETSVTDENGTESRREILKIKRMKEEEYKPDLFVIGLGVSEYKMSGYNLRYAAKDADDFCNALGNDKTMYGNKYKLVLKNNQVTKSALLTIRDFLKNADENDVVIVFMAGHGVLNNQLDYYFAGHDLDFNQPEKNGITIQELEEILASIKPFSKLLILDSCHSGELLKEDAQPVAVKTSSGGKISFRGGESGVGLNARNKKSSRLLNKMFMELNSVSGTTIITATSGADYAMESEELKNGLFTYCFLQGIKKMEADLNGDKEIMLDEMISYLRKNVSALSNGEQEPNTRYENEYIELRLK